MHEFRELSNASDSMGLADVSWKQELGDSDPSTMVQNHGCGGAFLGTRLEKHEYSAAAVKKRAVETRKRGAGCVEGCYQYPLGVLFSSTAVRSRRWFVNENLYC
jgi:hypothetical protein